jgi:hypothetical protein
MSWIEITDYRYPGGWAESAPAGEMSREYCRRLEEGAILYFAHPPFQLLEQDRQFLLGQRQSGFKGHKNISYRPKTDELRAAVADSPHVNRRLQEIMRTFSQQVTRFVDSFLLPYANDRKLDFASFRPIEEQNRDLPLHKRNDLVHVDAFPTRPTNGGRILRVFANINPTENRVWETTDPFPAIASRFADDAGLKKYATPTRLDRMIMAAAPLLKTVGVKGADRSPYDRFMLHFHDYLKENGEYQKSWPKVHTEFPPDSTWLVYTDTVPHAVMSGKFALEQTFIIPVNAMVAPQSAPIRVLEAMCGRTLSNI